MRMKQLIDFFFFSSRRRHTRCGRDWSSDVCSSDLGNGRRLEGPLTPQMFGYDASLKGYAPDPARARKLLAEAGYPDGLEIMLEAPAGRYQGDKEIAEALSGQW